MRLIPLFGLLALAACVAESPTVSYYPPGAGAAPAPDGQGPGVAWQGGGWTVERVPVPGAPPPAAYCTAARDAGAPDFALTETPAGLVGWTVTETTGNAKPSVAYPVELRFGPRGTVPYMAYLQGPGRLVGAAPRPDVAAGFARAAAEAPGVDVSSPVLGALGGFSLAGSRAAMAQLDACARGG